MVTISLPPRNVGEKEERCELGAGEEEPSRRATSRCPSSVRLILFLGGLTVRSTMGLVSVGVKRNSSKFIVVGLDCFLLGSGCC